MSSNTETLQNTSTPSMTSIQTHTVNGAGPYAYRVHGEQHPKAGSNGQHWEYLGPVHAVDPEQLTDDEVAELRSEGYGLARYRDGDTASFVHLNVANGTRDELIDRWGEDVLAPGDDRRTTELQLAEDAPRAAARLAVSDAESDRQDAASGGGQPPLTDGEKDRIDFSHPKMNTFKARSLKGVLTNKDIDDWTSYVDAELTVDEHESSVDRTAASGGRRLDNVDDGETLGGELGLSAAESMAEERAIKGVQEGYEEAETALKQDFGWSDDEITQIQSSNTTAAV